LVEFGVVAIALTALVLGVLEFGRMVLCYTTIANAARVGTRYAIVHGSDNSVTTSQIQTAVKGYLKVGLVNTSTVTSCTASTSTGVDICVAYQNPGAIGTCSTVPIPGCVVKVTVNYHYDPWIAYYPLNNIHLASTSEGVITF
jgi:Flp pilus assembly protein TadG